MLLARPLIRLILAPALALALSGCPSLTERAGLPPSVERAETLERGGDAAGAARVYEQLASRNSGAERNDLALRAARGYLAAHAREDAARVLAMLEGPLSAEQSTERSLSGIELALERGQNKEAWQQLSALSEPRSGPQAARYRELLSRAALAAGGPGAPPGLAEEAAPHIALLLPVTGRAAAAAISVRDGFLTAYYQTRSQERPRVRVYDTGTESVADALTLATRQGADFIVGPLTREEVAAAAEFPAQHAPLLALNFLPAERPAPPQFYQYALSPEDEARVAARRILEDQHRRGVALVPAGDWGERVLAAFRQELLSGGGELLATAAIDASRTDYSGPITELLGLSDSTARFKRLEAAIGTKLVFEPRRRGDVEFIFAPAQPSTERLLRPQLRFHYAGDFLRSQGFEILERNYRRRLGELDIVAERAGVLVIAEVRTRSSTAFGGAAASVHRRKQQRITRAAAALLQQRADLSRLPVRFDVIVVWDAVGAAPRIEWLQHAFEAC